MFYRQRCCIYIYAECHLFLHLCIQPITVEYQFPPTEHRSTAKISIYLRHLPTYSVIGILSNRYPELLSRNGNFGTLPTENIPTLGHPGSGSGVPKVRGSLLSICGGIPMDPAFLMTTPAGHPNRLGRRISRPNNVPPFLFPAWGIPRSVSITRPIGEGLPGFVSRKVSILSSLVLVLVLLLEVLTSPSSIPVHLFLDTCHR